MSVYKKGPNYLSTHDTLKARITGSGGGVCAHCVCPLCYGRVLCGCPSVMLTEDINSLLPEADNPSFSTQRVLRSCTVHIWLRMCATPQCEQHVCAAVCVCVSVCTPQSGVWVSKVVKVKQIGGVSWLLFKCSRNRSCPEYWLTAFIADSSSWHVIDIKCKTSIPVKEPMIICLHLSHSRNTLFFRPRAAMSWGHSTCVHWSEGASVCVCECVCTVCWPLHKCS